MLSSINSKCNQLFKLYRILSSFPASPHYPANYSSAPTTSNEPKQKTKNVRLSNGERGQPTSSTHPHMINDGELVVGVPLEEFKERRHRLMAGIQKLSRDVLTDLRVSGANNHLVVVPSAVKKYMSDKIPYVFRQNSDFYYLTGCLEPNSTLMMSINSSGYIRSKLYMRPKDKHSELWEGPRTGPEEAIDFFGVDEAYNSGCFKKHVLEYIQMEKPNVWFDLANRDMPEISDSLREVVGLGPGINSPTQFIQSMRLFKSRAEQALMRRTCRIASEAINEVMSEARPGQSEHHIYAMVDYKCRMKNASYLAYPPVVAAGSNATTIHYVNNCQLAKSTDLVLMDAGCEYGGYTSDVTRTWPISGTFTEPQRVLYDVIQLLQQDLIERVLHEGGDTLDQLFETMCIKLGKYLQEAGLVTRHISNDKCYAQAGYKFCPHHVSHYLGMDVHDTPLMSRSMQLTSGMVFTIEPGVYVHPERTDVPKEFLGLGVRIEDDILITKDNEVEVLTDSCIKTRQDIENLCKTKY